jgi:peptidoglycan/xylan/chitin deacetylase (PgdA/CDA1 family)
MLYRQLQPTILPRIGAATTSRALILTYHRVDDLESDPQMLCVTPECFAQQMEVLRRHFRVVPLKQLVGALRSGGDIAGMVAVSFDDGYADNLLIAKPVLERYEVPATVFIASDYIGGSATFWWDELEDIFLSEQSLPQKLRLEVDRQRFSWDFKEDALGSSDSGNAKGWYVGSRLLPSRRHRAYQTLHQVLYTKNSEQRADLLQKLRAWSGRTLALRQNHRTMTLEELVCLARSPLIEIGGHTATHPALSMLTPQQQDIEIRSGKVRLEQMIGRESTSFAYPYGSLTSFNDTTSRLVKEAGFDLACTTFTDCVRPRCDTYQLPRLPARNWNGEDFQRYLTSWITHPVN